jgi:hypothetical protein
MYPANHYVIRQATSDDERSVRQLAELDSQPPLGGPALIGEIRGLPAAAVSLTDGRVVADPFQSTVLLRQVLHMRVDAFRAYSRTPSLAERVRAGIRTVPATRTATG